MLFIERSARDAGAGEGEGEGEERKRGIKGGGISQTVDDTRSLQDRGRSPVVLLVVCFDFQIRRSNGRHRSRFDLVMINNLSSSRGLISARARRLGRHLTLRIRELARQNFHANLSRFVRQLVTRSLFFRGKARSVSSVSTVSARIDERFRDGGSRVYKTGLLVRIGALYLAKSLVSGRSFYRTRRSVTFRPMCNAKCHGKSDARAARTRCV